MLNKQKIQNRTIAIYGMGITGFSTARTLKKLGAKVFCWDDNAKIRKKIKSSNFLLNKFWLPKNAIDNIVLSPGIDINKCKVKKYLGKNFNKIITDLDLFFSLNKNSLVISITGTNGKSTTCKIIEKILKTAKFNVNTLGNIGNPVLSINKVKKKSILILEVSSYQLQYSRLFRSKYAAILNISPDHIERHGSIKNYVKIKSRIFSAQNNSDYSYINSKNKYTKIIKKLINLKKIKSKLILVDKSSCSSLLKKVDNIQFKSRGNIENLAFAYKIAKNLKISDRIIIKAINNFKGLPHRQEIVFSNKKFLCINDSKATSFDASLQSLLNYNRIYWIIGGIPKYKDRFYLKNIRNKIIKAYIIGKNISFFRKQVSKDIPYKISKNIRSAINDIFKDLKSKSDSRKTILLSPAGASFDQFDNFEDRGDYFKKLILKKFKRGFNV